MLDFFRNTCNTHGGYCATKGIKPCKSVTTEVRFGIIDDLTEEEQPAFIQEYRENDWDVTVKKGSEDDYPVIFKAIDKCLEFPPPSTNEIENDRCDGMLKFADWLIFVEIKYCSNSRYSEKAKSQLSRTIHVFNENHLLDEYKTKKAYISNKAKPHAAEFSLTEKDKFSDANFGFDLYRTTEINLP